MQASFSPHLTLARTYWKNLLKPSDLVIDATCGNGHDTLFLAELCLSVVAIDIQDSALANTEALLKKQGRKAALHKLPHQSIDQLPLPHPPQLIVYNLGYLPGGDKSITTLSHSTLVSVQKGLSLLAPKGALSITCYPGHEAGLLEEKALEEWASTLPSDQWFVCHHKWLNRARSPSLLWISMNQ